MAELRDNVCAVVLDREQKKILLCHRTGYEAEEGWQFPQGGIDTAKDIISEMKRELREEIGTDRVKVITVLPSVYTYYFPPEIEFNRKGYRYSGQRQIWILSRMLADDSCIIFNGSKPEFDGFIWTSPEEAVRRVVSFKKDVYVSALKDLGLVKY